MFALLFASYFYLRTSTDTWPPIQDPPLLTYGVINGIFFLLSAMTYAEGASLHRERGGSAVLAGLALAGALAAAAASLATHAADQLDRALLAPLVAIGLMILLASNIRAVFWVAVIPAALSFLLAWLALRETAPGRHVYAVGNNSEAARLTGIPVQRVNMLIWGLAAATNLAGTPYEKDVTPIAKNGVLNADIKPASSQNWS